MVSFFVWLIVCLAVNVVVSLLVGSLGGNAYLATMITSLVLSFLLALMSTPFDRKHFYRYRSFWMYFLITAIVFLIIDLITFLI